MYDNQRQPRRTRLATVVASLLAAAVAATGCTADPHDDAVTDLDQVDQVALQDDVPQVAELLRVAGRHPERLEEPELPQLELAHAEVELAGRLRVPATLARRVPVTYSGGGFDCDVPEFASSRFAGFDQVAEDLGSQWGIMSLTLAVSNECGTLYQQGYGLTGPWWARNALPGDDVADVFSMGDPMPADGLFRVASIVKPITAAAIHELDEAGDLAKDDFAFCVPGGPSNCILTVPLPDGFDERIGDITVRHLVGHRGGFDRGETAEYLFRAWEVYQARNLGAPPTEEDFMAHMLGLGLDFDPDATSVYSNLGYLILGLVIEQVSGQSYRDYVYDTLMAPLGIGPDEVVLSRTKRKQRDPREPAYWCKEQDWGGYSPVSTFPGEVGEDRCWADGGWVLEAMAAHGGLSMTASAVATFYAHWWNFGNPRDGEDYWAFPDGTEVARSHNGKLAATSTVAARCVNGLNVSLLTNQHMLGAFDYGEAERRLCGAADGFLAQGPHYTTVWVHDGAGPWYSFRGTPAGDYQDRFEELADDGYRLVDVNGYRHNGGTFYAHTWVHDPGAGWAATHGDDFDGFNDRSEELGGAGMRMVKVSAWNDGGIPRYASVWAPNPEGTSWIAHSRMSSSRYQELFEQYGEDNYRLIAVDGYELNGQPYFAAIWVHDPPPRPVPGTAIQYRAVHNASPSDYQDFFDESGDAGYRLTDVDAFRVGGQLRFAAVFTRESGPSWRSHSGWNFYTYQPRWQELVDDGWRPVTVAGY